MKALSVIIPFYNTQEQLFRKCLSSLMCERVAEIEIIVVDDGSSTDFAKTLDDVVGAFDVPISVFRKANGGQNSARCYGVQHATGRYLFFVDSDDWVDTKALDEVLDILVKREPEILAFNYCVVDGEDRVIERHDRWSLEYASMDVKKGVLVTDSLCTQIYRADSIRVADFVQGVRIGEDLASAVRILLSIGEASTVGISLYRYVKGHASALSRPADDSLFDVAKAFEAIMSLPREATSPFGEEIEWLAICHVLFWNGVRIVQCCGPDDRLKERLFAWMEQVFPSWRNNSYFERDRKSRQLVFRLIVSGKWKAYCRLWRAKSVVGRLLGAVRK